LRVFAGVRQSWFALLNPKEDSLKDQISKEYSVFEPRIALTVIFNDRNSIKGSYNRTFQFIHLLNNSTIGQPTDIWMPSENNIKPQSASMVSLGYYHAQDKSQYLFSVEVYYKSLKNIIDFVDNANLFLNPDVASQVKVGKGEAYGLEMLAEKRRGKLTGIVSYTFSKTYRTIPGINNGKKYFSRDDRRHAFSITGNYALSKRTALSLNFILNSGARVTVPIGTYQYQGASFNYYTERNSYLLPIYHRLDLSFIVKGKERKKTESKWMFGVYNVYDRKNVFSAALQPDEYNFNNSKAYGLAMFGIVPSISHSWRLK
jgi:hypothetical protein